MDRRSRNLLAAILTSLTAVVGSATVATAAPKDAAAKKLQRDAMDNDYLMTSFADAESKLKQAIKTCGASGCAASVLAEIHRDLGVIYIGGLDRRADGKAAFVSALKADPDVELDEVLTTPEIQKAFDEAKRSAGKASVDEEEEEPRPVKRPRSASLQGDFIHTPPAEQTVLTPVPVYVELPDDMSAAKVEVRYKPFGGIEWKTLAMRKMGEGYGIEIPCQDIGTTTGDLSYYVQAIGTEGDIVGMTGSRSNPVKVAIRNELSGDAPHLPNRPAPAQCEDAVDCPPGLPGCESKKKKKKGGDKGWGASCDYSSECESGLACMNGQCDVDNEAGSSSSSEQVCEMDADCGDGVSCIEGICGGGTKKWLVSITFQPDLAFMSGTSVCSPEGQQNDGYACYRQSDGVQYRGVPKQDTANAIAGGFTLSTIRVLIGIDRVFADNFTAGARLGYAFNGGPETDSGTSFLPLHAEGRIAYWLGDKPFTKKGIRPYFFLAGGMAQVDAKIPVDVAEDTGAHADYEDYVRDDTQDFPERQKLDAWKKMGQGFLGLGGGVMYATQANQGFFVDIKLMQMLPTSGTVIAPEIGYTIGF